MKARIIALTTSALIEMAALIALVDTYAPYAPVFIGMLLLLIMTLSHATSSYFLAVWDSLDSVEKVAATVARAFWPIAMLASWYLLT